MTHTDITEMKRTFVEATAEAKTLEAEVSNRRAAVDEQIAELNAKFADANSELLSALDATVKLSQETESQLRDAAIRHYETTGEKSLDENLGVQVRTKYIYENDSAVEWAEANAPFFIQKSIDKKAFEKIADNLDFVTIESTACAVIRGLK